MTHATVDGRSCLRIENATDAPRRIHILTITNPAVKALIYAVKGDVKYDGVKGDGYLEMWSCFPPLKPGGPEGQFFSRTLAGGGPMGRLSGSSDWRSFVLPFDRTGVAKMPTRLEINLFMPGGGTVFVGAVRIEEHPGAARVDEILFGGWWTPGAVGLWGGIGGGVLGCLGGLISWLVSKGKARRFVMAFHIALIALGCGLLAVGVAALVVKQPGHVCYPLVLGGLLLAAVFAVNLRVFRRRYREFDLRRMSAMDMGSN